MADRPLLSMVLIARDEAENIEPCFASWWDHVDEVVLCDTGSDDDTVQRAKVFAAERGQLHKLIVTEYAWHDDFAAARNHAESLTTGRWRTWCDLDDEIIGAEHLRERCEAAPDNVQALMFDYDYAQDAAGNCICTLKRERLVRSDSGARWLGRVHEAQQVDGGVTIVTPDQVQTLWRHRKQPGAATDRNLKILEAWAVDEPANGRVLQYLGTERAGNGRHEEAIEAYKRFLELDGEPEEYRAQCWRKLACSLLALNRPREALRAGAHALAENPGWADTYLTLAQASYVLGKHEHAIQHARQVIARGMPDTLLIVNPLDYTIEPKVVMAGSLQALGRLDDAIALGEEILRVVPGHPLLTPAYRDWLAQRKREKTAQTWLASAKVLCEHDEQLKALALLEDTVPHYVTDHPAIVEARSQLRERLLFARHPATYRERYDGGRIKPEDPMPEDQVLEYCERLPRAQFLARNLREMREAA